MNPPFSADERHILHAWAIAPPGCEIVSLCNWTILDSRGYAPRWDRKSGTRLQNELRTLIEQYGSRQNLGSVFRDAERTTDCEIGLVRLTKPGQRVSGADEFDGFFLGPDDIEAQDEAQEACRRCQPLTHNRRPTDDSTPTGSRSAGTVPDGAGGGT